MFNNHLMKVCLAAVFAIGLAACSSSSDQASAPDPMPTEPPTATEQIAVLQERINALRAQLGLDPIDIDGLTSSVSDLQGQVDDLTQQIADRDQDIADAAAMAMTATGKAVFDVLDPLGNSTTPAQSAIATPRADAASDPNPNVAATYGEATKLLVTDQKAFVDSLAGSLTAIDAAANAVFTSAQAGDPVTLSANNGFSGTMLTWSSPTKADTMTVYTDIGMSSSVLFSQEYGGGDQVLDPADTAHTGVTGAAFDGRTAGDVEHAPNAKLATTDAVNNKVSLPGYYKGAAGTYTCTPNAGAGCITRVSLAGVTFVDGTATTGWMFTANNGAMVSVADSAHMTFGWWMRDDKSTADILDNVAVFYDAPHPDALAVTAVTGVANYEGGAAGKYAWRDRVADTAHGGHFTAKAALTANFDTEMVSGSISDFRIGDDGMDPNWTITLQAAAIVDGGSVGRVTAPAANVVWAVGSSEADAAGSWEAQASNSGTPRNDNLPTGIAGAFDAEFNTQGRMIGAFGANITNPNPPK